MVVLIALVVTSMITNNMNDMYKIGFIRLRQGRKYKATSYKEKSTLGKIFFFRPD